MRFFNTWTRSLRNGTQKLRERGNVYFECGWVSFAVFGNDGTRVNKTSLTDRVCMCGRGLLLRSLLPERSHLVPDPSSFVLIYVFVWPFVAYFTTDGYRRRRTRRIDCACDRLLASCHISRRRCFLAVGLNRRLEIGSVKCRWIVLEVANADKEFISRVQVGLFMSYPHEI